MQIPILPLYADPLPDPVNDSEQAYADKTYALVLYFMNQFAPGYNTSISELSQVVNILGAQLAFSQYMGDYKPDQNYTVGQSVTSGGLLYYSKQSGNLGNTPDPLDETWWIRAVWSHSHSYNDLSDKPAIPSKTSDLSNDSGFITGVAWSNISGKPVLYTAAEVDQIIANIDALPLQTGNAGKFLGTDGTTATWMSVALIDDAATNLTHTWSSSKIQAALDALYVARNSKTPPQLDRLSIDANNMTTHTVNITNYNAALLYTVTVNNTLVATATRSGSVITVTLVDLTGTQTQSTTMDVYAYDPIYEYAGVTSVSITNHSVEVADDAIQVTDFSIVQLSNTGFTHI